MNCLREKDGTWRVRSKNRGKISHYKISQRVFRCSCLFFPQIIYNGVAMGELLRANDSNELHQQINRL